MIKSIVIPISGGMDSTYMLYYAIYKGQNVYPIILDDSYGKVGVREKGLVPAINIVREAGLHHRIHVIPFFPTSTTKISDGKYGYTPGRNMAIALAALAYADFVDATEVWLGFNKEVDQSFYPDNKQTMFDALSALYNSTYSTNINIVLPLRELSRLGVLMASRGMNIPWEMTVSCVTSPVAINCGVCSRCMERRKAFQESGIKDKTIYLKDA